MLYTMPSAEGELTSVYTKSDCQVVSVEAAMFSGKKQPAARCPADLNPPLIQESVLCNIKLIDRACFTQTTRLKAYRT